MGGDGGSFAMRTELVRTKKKEVKMDTRMLEEDKWRLCAASREPLREPVVVCPLGRVYNKDAALEALLLKDAVLSHVRSHKDLVTLRLEKAPKANAGAGDDSNTGNWICPLTCKEWGPGAVFCCSIPTGAAFAADVLDEMPLDGQCPVTGETLDTEEPIRTINPKAKEAERMAAAWEKKRLQAKNNKTKRKNKGEITEKSEKKSENSESSFKNDSNKKDTESTAKRRKTQTTSTPAPAHTKSVAIASLYAPRSQAPLRATAGAEWMVQGTQARKA